MGVTALLGRDSVGGVGIIFIFVFVVFVIFVTVDVNRVVVTANNFVI